MIYAGEKTSDKFTTASEPMAHKIRGSTVGVMNLKGFLSIGMNIPSSCNIDLPSGKLSHNYGKSPFFIGKLIINDNFQ